MIFIIDTIIKKKIQKVVEKLKIIKERYFTQYIMSMVDEGPHLIWSPKSLFGSRRSHWEFPTNLIL
jgi:hypothetical protein